MAEDDKPKGDPEDYLRSIGKIPPKSGPERPYLTAPSEGPSRFKIGPTVREALERAFSDSRRSADATITPLNAAPAMPNPDQNKLSERDGWIYGGVGAAAFSTLLGVGLFGFYYEGQPVPATIFTIIGVCGLVAMAILLKGHRPTIIHAAIIALVSTWVFFGYVIWFGPKSIVIHDQPTAEDIVKATAPIQKQLDEANKKIAALTPKKKEPATIPSPTPLNADEIQYRSDLRKFALFQLSQVWGTAFKLAYLSMQNGPQQNAPANALFRRVMQDTISPSFDTLMPELTHSNIETMDVTKIQEGIRRAVSSYSDFQDFWLDHQQISNSPFDASLMKQWFAEDNAAFVALQNLKTYPEASTSIKNITNDWFISRNHKLDAFLKDK